MFSFCHYIKTQLAGAVSAFILLSSPAPALACRKGTILFHTDIAESYLEINGNKKDDILFSRTFDGLCPNTTLTFSFWVSFYYAKNASLLFVSADDKGDTIEEKVINNQNNLNDLQEFEFSYDVPNNNTAITYTLKSVDDNSDTVPFIHNIDVRLCNDAPHINDVFFIHCLGSSTYLTVGKPNTYLAEPTNYAWYYNPKNNYELKEWKKVGEGDTLNFEHINNNLSGYYKVVMAGASQQPTLNNCSAASSNYFFRTFPCNDCYPDTTLLSDTICEGEHYTDNGFNINGTAAGLNRYAIEELNQFGCDSIVFLDLTSKPAKFTGQVYTIEEGDSVVVNGEVYTEKGTYFQTLNSADECGTLKIVVKKKSVCDELMKLQPSHLFFIDGSAPDSWQIEGIDDFPNTTVRIFDRNGRLLWEGKNYNNENGWDGTYNGQPLPSTDYWYTINSETCDHIFKGHFTLMRE